MEKCCVEGEGLTLSSGVPGCQAMVERTQPPIEAQVINKAGGTEEATLKLVTNTQGKLNQFQQECSTEFHRIRKRIDSVMN